MAHLISKITSIICFIVIFNILSYSQTDPFRFFDTSKSFTSEIKIKNKKRNLIPAYEDVFTKLSDSLVTYSIYNLELVKRTNEYSICKLSIDSNYYDYGKKVNEIFMLFYQDSIIIRVVGRYNYLIQEKVLNKNFYPLNYKVYKLEYNTYSQTIFNYEDTINGVKVRVEKQYLDSLRMLRPIDSYFLYYTRCYDYHFLFSQCYYMDDLPLGVLNAKIWKFDSYDYYSSFAYLLGAYNEENKNLKYNVSTYIDLKSKKYLIDFKNIIIDHYNHYHYLYYKPEYEIDVNSPKFYW